MQKRLFLFHVFFIQILLNLYPVFIIDIFYDNQTYIGNQMHQPFYLITWCLSTLFGFYFYSKNIWQAYDIQYSKWLHLISTFCMIVGTIIPYNKNSILNDLHVWLCIIGVILFLYEWFRYIPIKLNKNSILFFANIGLSLFFTFVFGHITSFCEIYFSFTTNLLLCRWLIELH